MIFNIENLMIKIDLLTLITSVIDHSISYLVTLKDVNGLSLLKHRRSTFVKGMVIAAKSARKLADDLLYRTEDPYSYVLNYKWSQDHAELLNASIRGRTGDNTNPNVQQFKSALKKILLHAALSASKYSNCVTFEYTLLILSIGFFPFECWGRIITQMDKKPIDSISKRKCR